MNKSVRTVSDFRFLNDFYKTQRKANTLIAHVINLFLCETYFRNNFIRCQHCIVRNKVDNNRNKFLIYV